MVDGSAHVASPSGVVVAFPKAGGVECDVCEGVFDGVACLVVVSRDLEVDVYSGFGDSRLEIGWQDGDFEVAK